MKKSLEKVALEMKSKTNEDISILTNDEIDDILHGLSVDDKIRCLKAHFGLEPHSRMYYPKVLYKHYRKMIIQFYMNARTTHYGALGHGKANSNEWAANSYRSLMNEFELPIPDDKIVWIFGDFNGPGSV